MSSIAFTRRSDVQHSTLLHGALQVDAHIQSHHTVEVNPVEYNEVMGGRTPHHHFSSEVRSEGAVPTTTVIIYCCGLQCEKYGTTKHRIFKQRCKKDARDVAHHKVKCSTVLKYGCEIEGLPTITAVRCSTKVRCPPSLNPASRDRNKMPTLALACSAVQCGTSHGITRQHVDCTGGGVDIHQVCSS